MVSIFGKENLFGTVLSFFFEEAKLLCFLEGMFVRGQTHAAEVLNAPRFENTEDD